MAGGSVFEQIDEPAEEICDFLGDQSVHTMRFLSSVCLVFDVRSAVSTVAASAEQGKGNCDIADCHGSADQDTANDCAAVV